LFVLPVSDQMIYMRTVAESRLYSELYLMKTIHVMWVPFTMQWRVFWFDIWRVAANILNKQSRIDEKGYSSSLGVGRRANNSTV